MCYLCFPKKVHDKYIRWFLSLKIHVVVVNTTNLKQSLLLLGLKDARTTILHPLKVWMSQVLKTRSQLLSLYVCLSRRHPCKYNFQFFGNMCVCVLQNHVKSSRGKQKNLGKMIETYSFVCFFLPYVFEACWNELMFDPKHIYPRGQEKYFKGHIMMHLKSKNLLPSVKKLCWGKNL